MANYAYVAKARSGQELSGFLAAASADEAISHLHAQGLVVLHVAEESGGGRGGAVRNFASLAFGRVGTRDLALFSRQFATILQSGIPLVRALRGLAADTSSRLLSRALADVAGRIERGEGLSDALAAHPEAFSRMFVSMIRAGERAGTLDEIAEQLAIYLEKVDAIKTKVRSAISYPLFVLIFALIATGFLLFAIVPTFADIYAEMGQELPGLTRAIVSASNAVRSHVAFSLAVLAVAIALVGLLLRTDSGRHARDALLLQLPVFGPLARKAVMSRFARTLGILTRSGIPLLEGLDLVRNATGNAVVAGAVARAREQVAAGHGITESFRSTGRFPEMLLQLMATGEESGELDDMLIKAADFYDRQVEATVHALASLIEPLMIVCVGALIGVVVISMFLPIFHLGEAVMKGGYNF